MKICFTEIRDELHLSIETDVFRHATKNINVNLKLERISLTEFERKKKINWRRKLLKIVKTKRQSKIEK